jgi:signal transduction histidine kinase
VALPYDVQVRHLLKPDNLFLYYIAGLFAAALLLINFAAERFGRSIRRLRDFASLIEREEREDRKPENSSSVPIPSFPNDELGEIGVKIAQNYHRLKEGEKAAAREREKLLQHVHSSEEGLCFFAADRTVEFYNGLFIQYLNTMVDDADGNPALLFSDPSFEKISSFVSRPEKQDTYFETKVAKQGKVFAVRVNAFDNGGFEIIINDITGQEKTRMLKQEMTGNITHELRTPVTAIRGCLETALTQPIDAGKERYFIQSAYRQALLLSELIQDMSLITRMEDAPHSFRLEPVSIPGLLADLQKDLEIPLREKNIRMEWEAATATVTGNRNLLYSIFRNLTDNAIRYAGTGSAVIVKKYSEDAHFYYFSYSDNGVGVPDAHLNRLFERFYRINEGRTRDAGGSGLGLSIVKNAVLFHKGNIVAKNRVAGGLEFLFTLPK